MLNMGAVFPPWHSGEGCAGLRHGGLCPDPHAGQCHLWLQAQPRQHLSPGKVFSLSPPQPQQQTLDRPLLPHSCPRLAVLCTTREWWGKEAELQEWWSKTFTSSAGRGQWKMPQKERESHVQISRASQETKECRH